MFSSLKRALKINDLDFFNLNTPHLPSFNFDQFKHHGFPPRPSSVSFDPLGVLVVGTEDGVLKINGETVSGSETTLVSEQKDRIIFAEIISEKGYATAVTKQSVELWNVNARQLVSRKTLQSATCVSSTAPHKSAISSFHFIYVGDERGTVYLIKFSETDIVLSQALNFDEKQNGVSGLAVNPKREEELLVAFNSGRVIICNMRSKEIAFEYEFSLPEKFCTGSMSCVCWLPSGHQFVCGYTNGLIAISSKRRESESGHHAKPKKFFSVNDSNLEDSKSRTPVRKICSGITKAGYFLVILGGSSVGETKCELFLLAKTKHKIGSSKHYSTSALCGTSPECTIRDFTLSSTNNSDSCVIVATNNGLSVLQLGTTSKLADEVCCSRGVFLLQNDPAYKFISVDAVSQTTLVNFASSMKAKTTSSKWLITGGRDPKHSNPDNYKLMISCHDSGMIRFWISGRNLDFWECIEETNLNVSNTVTTSTIIQTSDIPCIKKQSVSQVTERIVTHLHVVDAGGLFVFVGCLNGDTILLKYSWTSKIECSTEKQSDAPFLIEMPSDVSHGQSTNTLLPSEKVPTVGYWNSPLHGQATEHQLGTIRFSKPIQLIQATNSLCAIADCDGYLALFDWTNQQFQFRAAFTSTQPLASLLFAWIAVSQLSTSQAQTERKPVLICTLQNGSCYALVLTDNTMVPICTETKKSKIELAVCVDNTGRDITSAVYYQQCFQKVSENNFMIPEDMSSKLPTLSLVVVSQTEIAIIILEHPQFKKIKIDLKIPVQHTGLLLFETEKHQEPSCFLCVIQSEPQITMTLLNWDGSVLCKKEFIGCRLFAHDKILTYKDGNVVFLLANASVMTTNIFASINCDRIGCYLEPMSVKPRKNSDSKSFFQQLKKLTSNTEENHIGVDYDSYFPENPNVGEVGPNLKAETQTTENVMAKNLQALQERGEKLKNLEDKSADMANAAKDFLEMAKELKKSQQKPWYAL